MESSYNVIAEKRKQFNDNLIRIEELRATNAKLKSEILMLESLIRQREKVELELTQDKTKDIINGARCYTCGRKAKYVCFVCKQNSKPCGYCDRHYNSHKNDFGDHLALWVDVIIKSDVVSTGKKTDEQIIADLQAQIEAIKNRGAGI